MNKHVCLDSYMNLHYNLNTCFLIFTEITTLIIFFFLLYLIVTIQSV